MAPPNPKRPPRPPRPPGTQAPKDSDVELPFDDDEVDPLRADDPRPQRVPQFPAGSRRGRRGGGGGPGSSDRELAPRFDWSHEYSDPGHPPAFMYVERGPGAGQLVPLKQGPLVLGRSSSADLRLQHPSISRRHAQLNRRGDRFYLKDLSSQNGTFVNRGRVTSEVEVMPGDEITMGNALLRVRGPGGTPAAGIPAITTDTHTLPPRRQRRGGTFSVALLAAIVGSGLAALVTLIAIHLSGEEEPLPGPPPRVAPPGSATLVPPPGEGAQPGPVPAAPVEMAPPVSTPPGPMPTPPEPAAVEAQPEASAPAAAEPQSSPVEEASGPQSSPEASAPEAPASGPSALDVARGAVAARAGSEAPLSPAEADVLRRYAAGEVAGARDRARAAKLSTLQAQVTRFIQSEADARKALARRDVARAISQLTTAVSVDEALAPGGSKHGPQLRKRLSELHAQVGTGHARAGRVAAARDAFEQALKYDAGNRDARERLGRLSPAAAPVP